MDDDSKPGSEFNQRVHSDRKTPSCARINRLLRKKRAKKSAKKSLKNKLKKH